MNPFMFNAASNLTNDLLMKIFIPDHNYSRFIESKRNVFFWGERGCGKTMTLLYNKITILRKSDQELVDTGKISFIPVYVSCITPLIFKREYLLLDQFKASVISEHYFVLSMVASLIDSILELNNSSSFLNDNSLFEELSYIFDDELPSEENVFLSLKKYIRKQFINTQKHINRSDSDSFYDDTVTFTSILIPLIEIIKEKPCFQDVHFIFMMDDAHDLNSFQRSALNSWIAFRDNSSFSFKVSAAKTPDYSLATSSGGSILPGHDYVNIDIEKPFQNNESAFGQLASKIIARRLEIAGITSTPEEFFPTNKSMLQDIEESKKIASVLAAQKYAADPKAINDYVYKYTRAIYFRNRSPQANRPPYSGLETIVNISSGVVRNLLEPCYVMYDDMLSSSQNNSGNITEITPSVQSDVVYRLSESYWKRLRDGIDNEIDSCTSQDGKYVENLFNALAELFRKRLMDEKCSEPRAIAFTISAKTEDVMNRLTPILYIARRAQLLYVRSGSAKDGGATEDYFIPNKMLWPSRGLDPVGQHARVSIQARFLLDAALNKISLPYNQRSDSANIQTGLFDE